MSKPTMFLNDILNENVELLLKDGRALNGVLVGYDDHMNLVLEETMEETDERRRRLGIIVLRGNNVVSLNPED